MTIIAGADNGQQTGVLAGVLLTYQKQTEMKRVNVSHVSNEHNYWLRSLTFYKSEIETLKGILTEVAGKNTGNDVMRQVEHFENQFAIQRNHIDQLAHDIHVNVNAIAQQAQGNNAGYIDGELLTNHNELGYRFEMETRILIELIQFFRKFAAQWM
jgi:hypothetical protein